jgi:hypothetical protein
MKEFKPMGSTTNVTNVLYGTTWDDSTLLEKMKQTNLEKERKDGIRRHFRYDWQEVAKYNPDYLAYVEGERARLGEEHPLFLTQYRLLPIRGGGGFLNAVQRVQLQGEHSRLRTPEPGKIYVAGIDLAGESETAEDDFLKSLKPKQDSTVITIGEIEWGKIQILKSKSQIPNFKSQTEDPLTFNSSPTRGEEDGRTGKIPLNHSHIENGSFSKGGIKIKVVEHYAWTGRKHAELYPQLIDLIKNVWHCKAVVVDATGIGQPVASFLKNALGSRIIPFVFNSASKTQIGFNLLAAINSGELKMYAADNSDEYQEFWFQIEKAKGHYRPSQTMNFYVNPTEGHDDYLMSLALLVEAGKQYQPREARGS